MVRTKIDRTQSPDYMLGFITSKCMFIYMQIKGKMTKDMPWDFEVCRLLGKPYQPLTKEILKEWDDELAKENAEQVKAARMKSAPKKKRVVKKKVVRKKRSI